MFIESIANRGSPPAILLRESYREGKKVRKRTLANLSKWPANLVAGFRKLLADGDSEDGVLGEGFDITRTLPHGHVAAVAGMMRKIGIPALLDHSPSRNRDLALSMIAARILSPSSKLALSSGLTAETATDTLSEVMNVTGASEDELYGAMDWLIERQEAIERRLAKKHLSEGATVLYDLSSTWFEGTKCPLAKLGHSRDGRNGTLQVEFGLLCAGDGTPVAVQVFDGNTSDPDTVADQVRKLKHSFRLERIVLVGDRGMLTSSRIREDLKEEEGLDWISALRSDGIRKLIDAELIQPSLFDSWGLAEVESPDFPGERLIVCKNPLLAEDRARTREELLLATETLLKQIREATLRRRNPLRGKDRIGLRVGRIINKYKMAKHFSLIVEENSFSYKRRLESIKNETVLDGFYAVRTSLSKEKATPEWTVETYKSLSKVERAFRTFKLIDLNVRPVHHRLEGRVKGHILLCMLSYYVEFHMRKALTPLLFADEDIEEMKERREMPVQPVQRSPSARKKALTKENEEGFPVQSFKTLMRNLSTIARNTIRPRLKGAECFVKTTEASPLQRKAFELLGFKLE
jgi:transposase